MADLRATLSLPLLISLAALCFYPPTISSLPPPRFSRSSKYAPRFLGKFSRSNYSAPSYRYETRYFDQNLDHFSFSELPKFRQRYLINTEHWAGPHRAAPIFIYCGNEGDIEWFAANTGLVWEIAPRFRAMIVFPERESVSCFNTIKSSWDVIESEGQKKNGLSFLSETFRFCKELKSTGALSDWLYSAYSYLAMADYPYPADFLMPMPGNPIKEVCRRIDNCTDGISILQQIFEGVSVYYNYTGTVDCFDLDDDPHGMDGWNWQACTEMVMPMATSKDSMFPEGSYNYTSYEEWCLGDYHVIPRPNWITTEFGGHGFKHALKTFGSNIIFSNGLLDPWSGGSVLEDVSESIVALVTEKGAHHLDLRPSTAEDPDWLVEQREAEIKIIRSWLDEYFERKRAVLDM
ncbi:lysosomal Pro-Xaa carboxypeptidase [Salvia divinorum]|uniref:Lysosomal Pro-Xaa carboxypeptidase n=1 Tax=Salvia divinorum TaxID=28513 RepID=A0ABD1G9Q7_SALDI